jgi:hypothetical protein
MEDYVGEKRACFLPLMFSPLMSYLISRRRIAFCRGTNFLETKSRRYSLLEVPQINQQADNVAGAEGEVAAEEGGAEADEVAAAAAVLEKISMQLYEIGHSRINTRPVQGIIIGRGATTKRWQELVPPRLHRCSSSTICFVLTTIV